MAQRGNGRGLRVQSQGRAYVAVVGVTIGMLFAGLAVPLAFGRTPSSHQESSTAQLDPGFAGEATPDATTGLGTTGGTTGSAVTGGTTGASTGATTGTTGAVTSGTPGTTGTTGSTSGTTGTTGAQPGTGATPTQGRKLTATDQGVTATTVKLGVVLLDIRALEPLGFGQPHFTPDEQRQQYQTFIDQVNKAGGLAGRTIVPDYKTYNALDTSGANSASAICIQLAENDKVFGAIGVLGGNLDSCLTTQYGIPAISNTANISEVYRKAKGLFLTGFPTFERGTANWGDIAVRSGLTRGHKIGTLFTDIPVESKPETSLANALKAAGQPAAYRAKLASDQGTASSQMSVEIQKMQTAGVDTVFLVTNFITAIQFVQTAERQNFAPQYVVSDLGSLTAEGLIKSMPKSFNGAYAFTVGHQGESPTVKQCRTSFNAAHHTNYAAGNESGGLALFCFMVKTFSLAANNVGPQLTRKGMATAFQSLKSIPVESTLPGSFGPGKTDYADYMRPLKYASSCKCYSPAGGAQRGRY